ncbi:PREDICTED: transmembrane protein 241, partial [Fulmarus glacialis]|uniref:transmembrane protein 241 n=1 Tax=Fulmarus glacialis TaxID=30455 RepID=UPI00051BAEB6
ISERNDVFEATRDFQRRVRKKQHFGGENEISSQHRPLVSIQSMMHGGCSESERAIQEVASSPSFSVSTPYLICLMSINLVFVFQYVLSVLKFTYPTLFQGWQTLVGGLLLHVSWKLGWVEINLCSRSEILSWLPASILFVGIIYAGSRALSRLPIPVFLTVHNAAEVITCGFQKFVQKEQTSHLKVCSVLFLLVAAVCLPLCDTQFDPNGYLWALIHLICVGAYKVFHKLWKPSSL